MAGYREILRLRAQCSQREIALIIRSSRDTVREVFALSDKVGLAWPLPEELMNEDIRDMLYPHRKSQ